jgi:hypothetical protein
VPILSCGNIGYAYAMVMPQAFNGAGDTMTPTIVNLFGFWFLEIPLAIVIAEAAIAGASVLLFRRGRAGSANRSSGQGFRSQPVSPHRESAQHNGWD